MTDYMKIGRMVKRYRHWNELTQEQLAELIGVSTSFVGHIERGSRKMSVDTLYAICRALGVSSDKILDLDLDKE
jgi:transcriptional regulator with XRE-family HTH domain